MKDKINELGFTLIELLAVIVILAIIALIATPIVMNIIENVKINAKERSAENYIKQINNKTASLYANPDTRLDNGVYYIMSNGNLCNVELTSGDCSGNDSRTISIEMSGTKPTSGTIAIENSKVVPSVIVSNSVYTTVITISGNTLNLGPNGKTKKSWVHIDINSNDEIDIGDMISIGTENFYIISNDGTNIKALSQYNLNTTDGLQSENSANTVRFDDDSAVYQDSEISKIADAYKEKLNANNNANISDISLIQISDLTALGCTSENCLTDTINNNYKWIYSTPYWSMTIKSSTVLWYIWNNGYLTGCYYYDDNYFGVRPVITVSKDMLDS